MNISEYYVISQWFRDVQCLCMSIKWCNITMIRPDLPAKANKYGCLNNNPHLPTMKYLNLHQYIIWIRDDVTYAFMPYLFIYSVSVFIWTGMRNDPAKQLQPLHEGTQISQHSRARACWRLANSFPAHQHVALGSGPPVCRRNDAAWKFRGLVRK